ncbi:hypothetical protein NUACC21_82460 [Scytonema sp. NUACC21]
MKPVKTCSNNEHIWENYQNLKVKFDNLRLENQTLHIELENIRVELNYLSNLRYLLHRIVNIIREKAIWKFHQTKKTITSIFFSNNDKNCAFKEDNAYSSDFRPYQVQIVHPLQQDRPKVLHVIANFYTGGSSRLVVDLIEYLGHKFDQEVITRDYPNKVGYVGLSVHHYERFKNSWEALSFLQQFKPDFLHVHYLGHHRDSYSELDWKWYNNIFQAAQEYGCRIIENINIPTDPYVSPVVDYYVYVSDYVSREFGYLGSRNITIYPGSDLSLFSRKDEDDIPDDCIGMVYRLEGDKLNENSIDVFIKVIQRRSKTRALIVGGGYYLELYQNKVQQAGLSDAFTFTSYVSYEDLPALYKQMSIFVAPVHTESFGQVSPFAMGMEIPVVGYDVGAIEEIVGDCKLIASPGDSDTLASIIIDLLDDRERRIKIGIANRQRAQQLFSREAMIDSYSTLYDKILQVSKVVLSNA